MKVTIHKKTFEIVEIGNGPWCDPIEAMSISDALGIVTANLQESNPVDYCDEYESGAPLPTVDVTIRDVETDEVIVRTLTVGESTRR